MATTWQRGIKRVVIEYDPVTGDLVSVDARYYNRATSDAPPLVVTEREPFHVGPTEIPPAWVTTLMSIYTAVLTRINTDSPLP